MNNVEVSIILPTYNGISYIAEVLEGIFGQRTDFSYEVILIDSGSTDGTVEAVASYPVRIYRIEKADFAHGKTRNFGASLAKGKFLVFLTQDATPAGPFWLQELIRGFALDPEVACVFGKQIPRPDCDPITKRDMNLHFDSYSKTDDPHMQFLEQSEESWNRYQANPLWHGFNSNVNSALRKSVWEKIRFRDVLYTEDQLMGRDILLRGYKKVYSPKAAVYHSHQYRKFVHYFKRFFDEYRGMHIAFGFREPVHLLTFLPASLKMTLRDAEYIVKCTDLPLGQKIGWIYARGWINFYRKLAAYLGGHHESIPPFLKKRLSLEKNPGN